MTIDVTVDNSVIDYTSFSNLLETVKTHDDLFGSIATGTMGIITNGAGTNLATVSTGQFQVAGVKLDVKLAGKPDNFKFNFGTTFTQTPIVVATIVGANTNNSIMVVSVDSVTTTGGQVSVYDAASKSPTFAGSVHILAMGPRATS